jgi:Tol biopolymer transport system component/DNA-binding winged helix-turn-helix (wHTH) protein
MAGQLVGMSDNVQERIRFGPFEADLHTRELWKEGIRIKVVGQPFEILAVLLNKPGQLVTREELRARLWPADTFVDFNHGLNAAVNKLREALCDSAERPRYIETLPRRGYRFIAPIERVAAPENGRSQAAKPIEVRVQAPVLPPFSEVNHPGEYQPILASDDAPTEEAEGKLRHRSFWLPVLAPALLIVIVALVALSWYYFSHSSTPRAVGRRAALPAVPLTDLADPTSDPAISPDGTRVAFRRQGYARGNSGIFVKTIVSQQLLQLTNNPADCCPVWSPRGNLIAFSRFSEKEHYIYTIAAGGGGLHKLYATTVGPKHGELDWSPEGDSIAFVGESSQGTSSIFVLSKDLTARRVTEPAPLNRDWGPAFSPDGQSLTFVRTHETGLPENIVVIPAGGGESRTVMTFYNGILGSPAWTRDGQTLIFASGGGLFRAPVFGGDHTGRIEEAGSPAWHPSIARDGYMLAYQKVSEAFSIWELDPGHGSPKSHGLVVSELGRNEGAQISPDGKKIAFMSTRAGSMELWISNRDGSNPIQLTAMNGIGTPRWSPNSRSIAFDVGWRDRGAVFVVDVPGGVPRPLAQGSSDNLVPNWSRDGKWVYFASERSGLWQVWKMPIEGGSAVQVTTHGGFAAYPSIDGQTIFYSKFNLPSPEVWRIPAEGGSETRVPQVRPETWASWTPTEKGIYFIQKDSAEQPNVMFFDFASSQVSRVAMLDKLPFWLSASQDGKSLLYEHLDEENSHIMLLRNFQ